MPIHRLLRSNEKKSISPLSISAYLAIAVIGLYVVLVTLSALQHGISVSTFPTDGTFQLYNPLRRMADGQMPGVDFQFFHGIAIPIMHYPFFVLLGSNLFAAETLKFLMSPILLILSSLLFFYAYHRSWRIASIITALFIPLAICCIDVIEPGGSLRGLRGTMPVLIAAWILWNPSKTLRITTFQLPIKYIIGVILTCFALMTSTEHGIASIIAYSGIILPEIWRCRDSLKQKVASVISFLMLIPLTIIACYSIVTRGHPLASLNYSLIDVPADQSWYFGSPPNPYLSWELISSTLRDARMLPFLVIIGMGFLTLYCLSKTKQRNNVAAGFFLAVYGSVVFLGGITGYFDPTSQLTHLQRGMALLTIAFGVDLAIQNTIHKKKRVKIAMASLPIFILLLSGVIYSHHIRAMPVKEIVATATKARVSDDYFSLNSQWKQRIDVFKPYLSSHTSLWSTYVGVYESQKKFVRKPGSANDYIIHALGDDQRIHYLNDFVAQKPDYVTTLIPSYFYYEEWLWSTSTDFYSYLLEHYEIIENNESHFLWKRINTNNSTPAAIATRATTTPSSILLPPNHTQSPIIYEVSVDYSIAPSIIFTEKFERFLLQPTGLSGLQYAISLPPKHKASRMIIPVLPGDTNPSLDAIVDGVAPMSSFSVVGATYRQLNIQDDTGILFTDNQCFIRYAPIHHQKCAVMHSALTDTDQ